MFTHSEGKQTTRPEAHSGEGIFFTSKAVDRFKEITLDFNGVATVGQGFADEVFRVFQNQHPDITITPVNCNENVRFMIDRARAPSLQEPT